MTSKRRSSDGKDGFVCGGGRRAWSANADRVRREVEARYADALATKNFWGRFRLRLRMRREFKRRMQDFAPDGALYLKRE